MTVRNVMFYKMMDGKCPAEDFLDSLPGKAAQKVTWVLKILEDLEMIPSIYFKKLVNTDGIWECRVKLGSDIYRFFGFFHGNEIILTHGFVKKTQKTPSSEIERAQRYRRDYLQRTRGLQ
jgi:phage-related protein